MKVNLDGIEDYYRKALGTPAPAGISPNPRISFSGDFSALPESSLVKQSLDRAMANIGCLPDFVIALSGMSGRKYRIFINNFVGSHPDARYLEIGSWTGSTATAALYGNAVKAVCIDNWSGFGGPRSTFFANIERVRSPAIDFRFVESDFRSVDYASLGRFNIFMYDGPHEERDQYAGIMLSRPSLDKLFVMIVDDWNWQNVRLGTFRAFRDAGYSIASSVEIRTTQDNTHAPLSGKKSDWHNGYFIAVIVQPDVLREAAGLRFVKT